MTRVRTTVAHILFHVNAEAADSDPSQVGGVQQRAVLVRRALSSLMSDNRDLQLKATLSVVHDRVPDDPGKASLQRTLGHIEQEPQLAIQAWVSKNAEAGEDG